MKKWAKQSGFTVVELLIVIVVIGILAAITIVAYNGIQQRARNTTTISAVNTYVKLINLYMVGEGAYPLASSACLQVVTGSCSSRSATMDANLQKFGSLPSNPIYTHITYNYQTQTVDSQSSPLLLIYLLDGLNQECGVPNVVNQTGSLTYATDVTPPYNTNGNSGGRTLCYVHMPFSGV